jgi:hypothetical protein
MRARPFAGITLLALSAGLAGILTAVAAAADGPAGAPRAGDPSQPGPLPVATAQLTYTANGKSAPLDAYFPASGPAGPAVVLLPSSIGGGGPENHAGHGQHLASHGYVVGVVHDADILDPSDVGPNAAKAEAALDTLTSAPQLAGKVNGEAAIVGVHYNGSAAIYAGATDHRFHAIVGLYPGTFSPGGAGAGSLEIPYLVLGGNVANGLFCPLGTTWYQTFSNAGSIHTSGYLFAEAHPADFTDPPYTGDVFCGAPRAEPFTWIKGLMTAWLDYYLRGDLASYNWLYTGNGMPSKPADVTDSDARNAPQQLMAFTAGDDGLTAHLSWYPFANPMPPLEAVEIYRAEGEGPFSRIAALPYGTALYDDPARAAGTTYRYSAAYRDRGSHVFQTATPVAVVAGAPTPTASNTPRPTNTAGPTRTPGPTYTSTPSRTATLTRTPTSTRTSTLTRTPTLTRSPTTTRTPTPPRTATPTRTLPPGTSPSPGPSASVTVEPSRTSEPNVSATPPPTRPANLTPWVQLPYLVRGQDLDR